MTTVVEDTQEITLEQLRRSIDNMYSQLDPDRIDEWPVDGMEVWIDGEMYVINLEAVK